MTFRDWLEKKVSQGFEPDTSAPVGSSDNPSNRILTVANAFTVMRMLLTCLFLVLFIQGICRPLAIATYAVAACTDWADGQIARRTQTVSWFGKLLDPICDRFLLFTGVLGLVIVGELPIWVAILVIARDCYLAVGGLIVRRFRERPVDVVYIGKITTALLMFGFCDLLLGVSHHRRTRHNQGRVASRPQLRGWSRGSAVCLRGMRDVRHHGYRLHGGGCGHRQRIHQKGTS